MPLPPEPELQQETDISRLHRLAFLARDEADTWNNLNVEDSDLNSKGYQSRQIAATLELAAAAYEIARQLAIIQGGK